MPNSWFSYTGGDQNQPGSYTIVSGNPSCSQPKQNLCAINAQIQLIDGIEKPIITGPLQTEITAALMTKVESPNVRLKP